MLQKCCLKISRNISYRYHTVSSSISPFLLQQPEERIQRSVGKLLSVDKSSNARKSEMLAVFISSFDEVSTQVLKDFISFAVVSPTASETARQRLQKYWKIKIWTLNKFVYFSSSYLIPCLVKPKLFNDALKITHHMQFMLTVKC